MTATDERVYCELRRIASDRWPVTVREVAKALSISIATAHAHLHSLAEQGLAHQHPRNSRGGWLPDEFNIQW